MNRLRMTVVYEFDYTGNIVPAAIDRMHANFLADPTSFLHPHELEWDEVLVVDFEDITGQEDE